MKRHRRGFSSMLLVVMIMVSGFVVAALTSLFSVEMHRTQDARIHAQQRQLLLAGTVQALQAAKSVPLQSSEKLLLPYSKPQSLPIPATLAGHASLSLMFTRGSNATLNAQLTATVDGKSMRQSLALEPAANGTWTISSATLEGMQ